MTSVIHPITRGPNAVYRKTDPTQFVLRKGLEDYSDDDLAALEADICVFSMHGVKSSRLRQLLDISGRILEFANDVDAAAA